MVKKLMARQDFYTVPGIVVFLFIAFAGTAFAQGGRLPVTAKERTFLTPLPMRFVIHPGEAGYPRGICPTGPVDRCPTVLAFGSGELPTTDPAFKANLPNVRVTFTLDEVSNETPHTGASDYADELHWKTWAAADDEVSEATLPVSMVTQGMPWTPPKPVIIYDALVLGACGSFTAFPSHIRRRFSSTGSTRGISRVRTTPRSTTLASIHSSTLPPTPGSFRRVHTSAYQGKSASRAPGSTRCPDGSAILDAASGWCGDSQ